MRKTLPRLDGKRIRRIRIRILVVMTRAVVEPVVVAVAVALGAVECCWVAEEEEEDPVVVVVVVFKKRTRLGPSEPMVVRIRNHYKSQQPPLQQLLLLHLLYLLGCPVGSRVLGI
jgi:hypothetical protein